MIDTHAHLTDEFFENIEDIVQESKTQGLEAIISCSTKTSNFEQNLFLGEKYKNFIFPSIGIHPENAHEFYQDFKENLNLLQNVVAKNRTNIYAIGECGLDYYHSTEHEKEQKTVFEEQIKMSLDLDLPLIIHTRNSKDISYKSCILDGVEMLKKYPNSKGVCHCFSGSLEEAKQILDIGFYIGFTNIVTYKNSTTLKEVAESVIREYPNQILFETDSPYLPPAHNRGGKCHPADVKYVYDIFKEQISLSNVNNNIITLFNINL